MFAVLDGNWSLLSPFYRSSPYLNLDEVVTGSAQHIASISDEAKEDESDDATDKTEIGITPYTSRINSY